MVALRRSLAGAGLSLILAVLPISVFPAPAQTDAWVSLFDGTSLTGWRGFTSSLPPANWHAANGVLWSSGPGFGCCDIMTNTQYSDFELALEWKISRGGNSGILYRVLAGAGGTASETGPEYQILDNRHGEAPVQQAASLYDVYPPARDVTRPVGQWNQARIVVEHNHVEHWLNGVKVVEYSLGSSDLKNRVEHTRFANLALLGEGEAGYIALQDHASLVWFRNIRIRRLPRKTALLHATPPT